MSQGVIQNLGTVDLTTLTGGSQTLAMGPVASQEAIKLIGTNGGGFFNVNSAMPFDNPTAFSNFVEMLFILLIPAGLTATFGRMAGSRRQGWAIYGTMMVLLVAVAIAYAAENTARRRRSRPGSSHRGRRDDRRQHGGQGAAQRDRRLRALGRVTTVASNGSVNSPMIPDRSGRARSRWRTS